MYFEDKDVERFWAKVDKSAGDQGCWEWIASRDKKGYGAFGLNGKRVQSHRLSAAMAGLDIEGLCVCHKCDNPSCVNPDHLFAGTKADNNRDMVEKGRASRFKGSMNKGSAHGNSKLTEEDVVEIKERLRAGETQTSIAKDFGVSRITVSHINTGRYWKHVK